MDHKTLPAPDLLLAVLCYDDSPSGFKSVRNLVEVDHFDNFYRKVAEEVYRYIDRFDKPPGEHTYDIFEKLGNLDPDNQDIYSRIYQGIDECKEGTNADFVLVQAQQFVRQQRMRDAMTRAIQVLNTNDPQAVDEAHKFLEEGLGNAIDLFDSGTEITDTERSLRFLDLQEDSFPTGIEPLDRRDLGPLRKGLHLFGAAAGRGKSLWLLWLSRQALLSRKRVLYVTLEMPEELVCQRFFQCNMAITKRPMDRVSRNQFKWDTSERRFMNELELKEAIDRPNLQDPKIRNLLTTQTSRMFGRRPKFYVKNFPSGRLTVRELEAYLDSLLSSEGFHPDLLIVDYADLMDSQVGVSDHRIGLGRIYVQLRGMAMARNMAVATATQLNRASLAKKTAGMDSISEDFSKAQTADIFITYSRTDAEDKLGMGRLFVAKGRNDQSNFSVVVTQCYDMCQFVTSAVGEFPTYSDVLEEYQDEVPKEKPKTKKRRKLASGAESKSS